jgi:cell division protease FtsH
MRKVPIAPDVNASIIARGTPGMSGADLANIVNEAALFAARRSKRLVDMDDFEEAKDKIYMGAARKSMVITPRTRRRPRTTSRATRSSEACSRAATPCTR